MKKHNQRVVITHSEVMEFDYSFHTSINVDYGEHPRHLADVYFTTKEGCLSITKKICAIPEMEKAIEAYMDLKSMRDSLTAEFDVKSKEVERLMEEAYTKIYK